MLKNIGIFEIDADVSKKYNEYVLKPINDKQSLDFLASLGIKKMFQGEMFFHAVDLDQFLGRTASFNFIGTIDNATGYAAAYCGLISEELSGVVKLKIHTFSNSCRAKLYSAIHYKTEVTK